MGWDSASPGVRPAGATARGVTLPLTSPHWDGRVAGHPWPGPVSEIRAGRDLTRGLRAAFHPLALARLGAVFIPETPAWKNAKGQHAPPPPRRFLFEARIEPGSPPFLRPQPSLFRGGGPNAPAPERQGTHSWAAPPAASCEPAKSSFHSLRLAPSSFRKFYLHLCSPLPAASMVVV